MDMKFLRGGGPYLMEMNGNVPLKIAVKDSRYSYMCYEEAPSLEPYTQRPRLLQNYVIDKN